MPWHVRIHRLRTGRRLSIAEGGWAVDRTEDGMRAGGHDVPEIAESIARSDSATVYDNSRLSGPRIVAQLSGGGIVGRAAWPAWAPETLRSRWP